MHISGAVYLTEKATSCDCFSPLFLLLHIAGGPCLLVDIQSGNCHISWRSPLRRNNSQVAKMWGVKRITSLLLLCQIYWAAVIGQLVSVNSGVEVPIGRSVYLDQNALAFEPIASGEKCKVEVALSEPYYQRVGILQPEVFRLHA